MRLADFDYDLPADAIAQFPLADRASCRLLALDRGTRTVRDRSFSDILSFIDRGDLLVLNDTRVLPARLLGRRRTGGRVEVFLLEPDGHEGEALVRPSARLADGETITLDSGDEVEVLGRHDGMRRVRFSRPAHEVIERAGHVPLPPYIARADEEADRETYQTVFGRHAGATASPTAGLHFTWDLIERVKGHGARVKTVTLHTSYGTFAPVKTEEIEKHTMHREYFELPAETMDAIRETKKSGGKVIAVGTTSVRVLEHCASEIGTRDKGQGAREKLSGYTDIFIYPGYQFKVVDRLITNFHAPRSTLLMLVSAFAGREFMLEAYRHAVKEKYRFLSYGDAMLIL